MMYKSDTHTLPRGKPEEFGLPSRAMLSFLDSLEGADFQVHSLMLLRHGHVLAEAWWHPYDRTCRRYLYSLSKSFTSTAVGFAVQEGLLDVQSRVVSFFEADLPPIISANLQAMRVKDLLTMSTGHGTDTTITIFPEGLVNWAQVILSAPVDFYPGTHFLYNSGATYLLSCIVQQLTGQTVLEYLTPRLFGPLGIDGMTWETCPRGINTGGWGLSLSTEDLAKFGQFCLQRGRWEDRQPLSAAWIDEATSAQAPSDSEEREKQPTDWNQGYGYQFWRCQHNAYRADGAYGQYCVVMPDQDAVLALTSETPDMQDVLDRVWQHLLPAMSPSPLTNEPHDRELLQSRIASLQIPLPSADQFPVEFDKYSGKQFKLQENPLGLRALSFSFGRDSSRLQLFDDYDEYQLVFGYQTWKCSETWLPILQPHLMSLLLRGKDHSPMRVAAYGQWIELGLFRLVIQYLETPHSTTLAFNFQDERIRLEISSSMAKPSDPFYAASKISLSGVLQPSTSPVAVK